MVTHYINISDKLRIAYTHNEYSEDYADIWGLNLMAIRGGYPSHYNEFPDSIAFDILQEYLHESRNKNDIDSAIKYANRYLKFFNCGETLEVHEWRGYCQHDWQDFLVAVSADYDQSCEIDLFFKWLRGDDYTVWLEELQNCTSERGDLFAEWFSVDGCDASYLGEPYGDEWVKFLRSEFDLSVKELGKVK